MKKLSKKLSLNKETISKLNDNQLNEVVGGKVNSFLSIGARCHSRKHPTDCATVTATC